MARVLRRPRLRTSLIAVYLLTALVVSVFGLRQWFFGAEALATWVAPTSNLAGQRGFIAIWAIPICWRAI